MNTKNATVSWKKKWGRGLAVSTALAAGVLFSVVCVHAGMPADTILDEAKVPPYTLPDPLVCQDGTRVTDVRTWREKRRPELLRLFESEEYGKTLLGKPEAMRFVVREEKKDALGGKATRLRVGILFEGKEDGRQMELLVYLPNNAKGPVPVFLGLNFDGNYSTTDETDIPLPKYYAYGLYANKLVNHTPTEAGRGIHKAMWQIELALDRGYGVATAAYGEIEPDMDGCWKQGPRGLGPEPGLKDWGTVGVWAWALSRAVDYLETNPRVDSKRIAVLGFSRLGKTAMWAGAQDERIALVVSNASGAGGVALSKRIFGETVADLMNKFTRWFCPNFRQYAKNEAALPMDQHELAALIAPRPLLITSGTEDLWSDPKGEFLGGLGADPVYRLLGTDGLSQKEQPAPGQLVDSRIGYFLRVGRHDVTLEDWQAMLTYADRYFRK